MADLELPRTTHNIQETIPSNTLNWLPGLDARKKDLQGNVYTYARVQRKCHEVRCRTATLQLNLEFAYNFSALFAVWSVYTVMVYDSFLVHSHARALFSFSKSLAISFRRNTRQAYILSR